MGDPQNSKKLSSYCVGCGHQILDRFILRVSPDLEWHAQCLKCAECHQYLDESCSCFIRDGQTFCKEHYSRLSANKCAKCHKGFISKEYVMRTRVNIYHVQCFRCEGCSRPLFPGDEYFLQDGQLFCTDHHHRPMVSSTNQETVDPSEGVKSAPSWSSTQRRSERATRVRTVLSESQLQMLQTCYSANPRPDALMKEQLVEMTGLSPRVIRVWFQNKRCKDKKRCTMMKHTQKQPEGHLKVSEEPRLLVSPESRDPPWKLLTDFILQNNAEHRSYQQLPNSLTASPTDFSE